MVVSQNSGGWFCICWQVIYIMRIPEHLIALVSNLRFGFLLWLFFARMLRNAEIRWYVWPCQYYDFSLFLCWLLFVLFVTLCKLYVLCFAWKFTYLLRLPKWLWLHFWFASSRTFAKLRSTQPFKILFCLFSTSASKIRPTNNWHP